VGDLLYQEIHGTLIRLILIDIKMQEVFGRLLRFHPVMNKPKQLLKSFLCFEKFLFLYHSKYFEYFQEVLKYLK